MNRRHSLPAEVYALVEQTPASVLLESGKPHPIETNEKPWTRLFTAPLRVCAAYRDTEVPELFAEIESSVASGLSAAGFFSYECGNCFEPKAGMRASREDQPLAWFGIYERGYAFDHPTGKFVDGEPPELERFRFEGRGTEVEPEGELGPEISAEFALTENEYAQSIAEIHEWIRAGDVYQINFTAPWRVSLLKQTPRRIYAGEITALSARQPVDYGAFVHWREGRRILSFSPELFFRVDGEGGSRRIVTRPMKGTAPRGSTIAEDREISQWLSSDQKNRAENLMNLYLLRNDLARLAEFGSVHTEKLFAIERYATLWQMTSTISADLRREVGFHDIFRALFPCGSVTGAPKVRAMQLIAQLEDAPRGVYTGAIGFFSPEQTIFNVAIRTLELDGERGTMGVGSGIVIDSDAAAEFRECSLKAEFLTRAASRWPHQFSLIETTLWDGGYPLLEMHLDRLNYSAEYFGFACEPGKVREALEAHARTFEDRVSRKVRLLLDADGNLPDQRRSSRGQR